MAEEGSVELPEAHVLSAAASTFSLLASPTRLAIVWQIRHQGADVTTIARALGMSGPAVSQHLAKLRLARLVSVERHGRHQVYVVDDPHIVSLAEQAVEHHEDLNHR